MNPTIATWMLFLHVLAALWLAAGVFSGSVVRAQGRKAATPGERVLALRIAWRLANVYSLPGGIVAGLLGIGLLHPRGWTFGALWVQISMTLWLAMLLNGILYLRPTLPRPLSFPARVSGRDPDGRTRVRFHPLSDPVADLVEKLAFRRHRRHVAEVRRPR